MHWIGKLRQGKKEEKEMKCNKQGKKDYNNNKHNHIQVWQN